MGRINFQDALEQGKCLVLATGMETQLQVSQPHSSRCTDKTVPPATGILSFIESLLEPSVLPIPTVSETVVRDWYHIKWRQFLCELTPLIVREDYPTNAVNQICHVFNRPAVHLSSHPVARVLLFTRTKIHDWESLDHRISGYLYPNIVFFKKLAADCCLSASHFSPICELSQDIGCYLHVCLTLTNNQLCYIVSSRVFLWHNVAYFINKQSCCIPVHSDLSTVLLYKSLETLASGRCGDTWQASYFLLGLSLPWPRCVNLVAMTGDVQINSPWVSACGCVFSSSSRESGLKITTAAFIQDGMKGLLALLCDEPRHHLCWNTACTSYGTVSWKVSWGWFRTRDTRDSIYTSDKEGIKERGRNCLMRTCIILYSSPNIERNRIKDDVMSRTCNAYEKVKNA